MSTAESILSISLEQGLAFALLSVAAYISFRALNFPDLTIEGSFAAGAIVGTTHLAGGGSPYIAIAAAAGTGAATGLATALLHTVLGINRILAGILTLTGVYSVNLRVMGRANISLLDEPTIFTELSGVIPFDSPRYDNSVVLALVVYFVVLLLWWFFRTDTGLALRATGDNEQMIRGLGVNVNVTVVIGLMIANGLVGLSGGLVAQQQQFADIGMGFGTLVGAFAGLIIGETLFRARTIPMIFLGIILGVVVYRILLTTALYLGLAPSDLRLASAVLVAIALSLPLLRGRAYRERAPFERAY